MSKRDIIELYLEARASGNSVLFCSGGINSPEEDGELLVEESAEAGNSGETEKRKVAEESPLSERDLVRWFALI